MVRTAFEIVPEGQEAETLMVSGFVCPTPSKHEMRTWLQEVGVASEGDSGTM